MIGGAYSTYEGEEKFIEDFGGEKLKEKTTWKIKRRLEDNITWGLKRQAWRVWSGSICIAIWASGCCESCNELSGYINCRQFIE